MAFYEIEFPLAALSSEAVEAALFEVGASSITFVDRGDEPVLEPRPGEVRGVGAKSPRITTKERVQRGKSG